jgi:hypothetical protein
MAECQVLNFPIPDADLCTRCGGTGNEPQEELCCHCGRCFDDVVGWSTGIEPGTESQRQARLLVVGEREKR